MEDSLKFNGLTIKAAMRSGRLFKRPSWYPRHGQQPWLVVRAGKIVFSNTGNLWTPRPEDLLAEDYEIQASKNDIMEAVARLDTERIDVNQLVSLKSAAAHHIQIEIPF